MKIGLIDIDGHNFPNLALMKISAYHKQRGDSVEWVQLDNYDRTYMSKVFTYTSDHIHGLSNYGEIIKGGTGFGYNTLGDEIEHIIPDYSIYKYPHAMGFLTRGCPNKCSFCIVPQKEGGIRGNADITEFWGNQKAAILLDNNVLASEWGLKQIEKIIYLGIKIDFNQGLDAKIISENRDIAKLLSRVRWFKPLRMACDSEKQIPYIEKAVSLLREYNTTPSNFFVYTLVRNVDEALRRVMFLKELNLDPFAQPFIDRKGTKPTKEQKRFARWVNHKAIFNTVNYKDYATTNR